METPRKATEWALFTSASKRVLVGTHRPALGTKIGGAGAIQRGGGSARTSDIHGQITSVDRGSGLEIYGQIEPALEHIGWSRDGEHPVAGLKGTNPTSALVGLR